MKHEQYKKAFNDLGSDIKHEIVTQLVKENAGDIQLHTGIIFNFIDDQMNEVIKRVDVVSGKVQIDSGGDDYWLPFDSLTVDQLLGILEAVEFGSYDVWAQVEE